MRSMPQPDSAALAWSILEGLSQKNPSSELGVAAVARLQKSTLLECPLLAICHRTLTCSIPAFGFDGAGNTGSRNPPGVANHIG